MMAMMMSWVVYDIIDEALVAGELWLVVRVVVMVLMV
jgi:hypothetical protein